MLEADEQRDAILALWWLAEELDLVATLAYVQLAGNTEGLEVRKCGICQLVDDHLPTVSLFQQQEGRLLTFSCAFSNFVFARLFA